MSRILIVEDDNDIAALIAHYLDKAGHASESRPTAGGRCRWRGKRRPISLSSI